MPNYLSELLLDESFVRFLKDQATDEEFERWTAWKQESRENTELERKGRRLLNEGFHSFPDAGSDAEVELLNRRINATRLTKTYPTSTKRYEKTAWPKMAVAASIMFLVGLTAWLVLSQNDGTNQSQAASIVYKSIMTEYGERTSISYSDGSKIVLNANSDLKLPQSVTGKHTIEVWLEGEAFFDIYRKPEAQSREFIVHTPHEKISVLGTRFAVNTYESRTMVVLEEGKVRVSSKDTLAQGGLDYDMKPGEMAILAPEFKEIQVSRVNPAVYTSWARDSLILDSTPLSDLVKRLENTYGLKVVVENKELLNEKLTGKFKTINLEVLLKGLSETLDVAIDRIDDTIYIRG